MLAIKVHRQDFGGLFVGVLENQDRHGSCRVRDTAAIASNGGILGYLNAQQRFKDAVRQVEQYGGSVAEPIHAIVHMGFERS
jgi:hypothetical protein